MKNKQKTVVPESGAGDLIARAFAREREAWRRVPGMELESAWMHLFRCVCCGRVRAEEKRREPRSQVCVQCVEAAGFVD